MRTHGEKSKQPSTYDGHLIKNASGGTWADAIGASASTSANNNASTMQCMARKNSSAWQVARPYLNWDLSDIGIPRRNLRIVSAKIVLRCTNRSVADTNGDIIKLFKANVDHDGSGSDLATADFDQYSTAIKSTSEVQVSSTGNVDVPIDGVLMSWLRNRLRAGGELSVFLLNKLDYAAASLSDPAGLNRLLLASANHSTSGFRPKLVVVYSHKKSQRDRRKGGGGGGFGEIHIPSTGLSGFSGER